MIRFASLLTVPLAAVLGLGMFATSADAGHSRHKRSDCEQRIFQKDEELACFSANGRVLLFRRNLEDPSEQLIIAPDEDEDEAEGFTLGGEDCGCQLRRRYDFICAGGNRATIGNVDRRGRRLVGEMIVNGEQTKLVGTRVDASTCLK